MSKQRQLELLVVQARLMQEKGATKAQLTDLRQALPEAQFRLPMGEEKIRHKLNTMKLVTESMDKGWKTWSAQAAELQLLRTDRDNWKAQGEGFFKMTEEAISTLQEDIAKDLYDIAACHQEEVSRIMHEFDKHKIDTIVQLEAFEVELDKAKPKASAHWSQLHHHHYNHRPSIHTNVQIQTTKTTRNSTNLLCLIFCMTTQRMNWKKTLHPTSRHKGVPWVRRARPWPTGVPSVTRTKG